MIYYMFQSVFDKECGTEYKLNKSAFVDFSHDLRFQANRVMFEVYGEGDRIALLKMVTP